MCRTTQARLESTFETQEAPQPPVVGGSSRSNAIRNCARQHLDKISVPTLHRAVHGAEGCTALRCAVLCGAVRTSAGARKMLQGFLIISATDIASVTVLANLILRAAITDIHDTYLEHGDAD